MLVQRRDSAKKGCRLFAPLQTGRKRELKRCCL